MWLGGVGGSSPGRGGLSRWRARRGEMKGLLELWGSLLGGAGGGRGFSVF